MYRGRNSAASPDPAALRGEFRGAVQAAIEAYARTGHMVDAALAYAAHGVPVFPVSISSKKPVARRLNDDAGNPIDGTGGFKRATTDPEQIRKWWWRHKRHLIGIPMGLRTGVWALDVDTDIDHADDGIAAWSALQAERGSVETREHRTASEGLHLIFTWSEERPIGCSPGSLPAGMEVKAHGSYIVAPPSQRRGKDYVVSADIDPIDAPAWLYDLIGQRSEHHHVDADERREASNPFQAFTRRADPNEVEAALRVIPADCGELVWAKIASAVHHGLGEAGWPLFLAWSKTGGDSYKGEHDCRKKWKSAPKSLSEIKIGTLFYIADQADPAWRSKLKPVIAKAPAPEIGSDVKRKPPLTFQEAVSRIDEEIRYFLDEIVIGKKRNPFVDFRSECKTGNFDAPRAWAIIAPPGTWKSSIVRRQIAELLKSGSLKKVVVMIPRIEFAEEYQREFAALGIRAEILRGRTGEDDKHGPATCWAMDEVELAQDIGVKVSDYVCKKCQHNSSCPYMLKMQAEPQVWIAASNYLFHEQKVLKGADCLIIDEGFHSRGIEEDVERHSVSFDANEAVHPPLPGHLHTLFEVLIAQKGSGGLEQGAVIEAFVGLVEPGQNVMLTVELREAEMAERRRLGNELMPRLKKLREAPRSKAREVMQAAEVARIQGAQTLIKIFRELRRFVNMWSHDQREDAPIRSGRVLIEKIEDGGKLLVWRGISRITKQFQIPTLLLNVEYEKEIIEAFIPQIESPVIIEVAMPETTETTQILGAPTSATKIGDPKKKKKESDAAFLARCQRVEENRQKVRAYIVDWWRDHGMPKAVVISQKDFRYWIEPKLPDGINADHYGNTAGTNKHEDRDLAFIVGRALPGPKSVESTASTISGLQVQSVVGNNPKKFYWYPRARGEIKLRDGSIVVGRGHFHPDALANAMVRSILSELTQAYGRPRPWGRGKPLTSLLLLDEPVPGAIVDKIKYWEPGPFDEMIENGIVLTSEVDLMRLWPKTFTSVRTTRRQIKALKVPDGWRRFSYRLKGQRGGRSKAGWYDADRRGDPRGWLVERLGDLSAYETL
jgi:Bifunctional DNA primase/polymerase, N-terminal/Primase C terminal 2 (PriCT-2)